MAADGLCSLGAKKDTICCEKKMITVRHSGNCGGHGQLFGCENCKKVYMQVSGGLAPAGTRLVELTGRKLDDFKIQR